MTQQILANRIMIVDDQGSNTSLLEKLLKKHGYAQLKSLNDPRQVIATFQEWQPDLILLDLMMPHMSGFDLLEALKPLIPQDDYLPVLVLTADITLETKQRALSSGAADFLTKPFDAIEVVLRIKNILQTRALHKQLQSQNAILEEKVRERTAELQRQFQNLAALHRIDQAITSSLDLSITLNIALDELARQLGVDAAVILRLTPHSLTLDYAAGRGFHRNTLRHTHLRLGEGYAGRAALERQLVHVPDLRGRKTDFLRAPQFAAEGFVAYYAVPLIVKANVLGVLEVFHRSPLAADEEWVQFLETFAGQMAIALENAALFDGLQRSNADLVIAYDSTLEGWSRAMDLRDKETEGHSRRVAEMTLRLADAIGMSGEELVHVRRGALLHDMGKLGVPDSILLKPGQLTDEEWVIMRQHPTFAYEMLAPIPYLRPALDIPYCHHEKWDGSGYPRGLKGEEIPLAARLFAVVDVWDALRSDRPYRQGWPVDKVFEHIGSLAGIHFDPQAAELFLQMMEDEVRVQAPKAG